MDVKTDNSEFYTLDEAKNFLCKALEVFKNNNRDHSSRFNINNIDNNIKNATTLEYLANLNFDETDMGKLTSFSIAEYSLDVKLFKTLLEHCTDKSLTNQRCLADCEYILSKLLINIYFYENVHQNDQEKIFNLILSNLDNLEDVIKYIVKDVCGHRRITTLGILKSILNHSNFKMLNRFYKNNLNEFEALFEANPDVKGIVEKLIEFTLISKTNKFKSENNPLPENNTLLDDIFNIVLEYADSGFNHINTYALDIHSDIRAEDMSDEEIIEKIKQKLKFKREFIDLQDFDGNTWLHLALINDRKELIKFLQNKGASQDIENLQSETAVQLSMNRKLIEGSWSYTDIIILSMLFVIGLISILSIMSHTPFLFAAL